MVSACERQNTMVGTGLCSKESTSGRRWLEIPPAVPLRVTVMFRFGRRKEEMAILGLRRAREVLISSRTRGTAVAVSAIIGISGRISRKRPSLLYCGRKSWPQADALYYR